MSAESIRPLLCAFVQSYPTVMHCLISYLSALGLEEGLRQPAPCCWHPLSIISDLVSPLRHKLKTDVRGIVNHANAFKTMLEARHNAGPGYTSNFSHPFKSLHTCQSQSTASSHEAWSLSATATSRGQGSQSVSSALRRDFGHIRIFLGMFGGFFSSN